MLGMNGLVALLSVGAAQLAPQEAPNNGGEWGWRCTAEISLAGHGGYVSRDFGKGVEAAPYIMEARWIEGGRQRSIVWALASRGNPARDSKYAYLGGRAPAHAFRDGPDYVHIDFDWLATAVGPIWAHYWGDGAYAGADLLMTRRQARQSLNSRGELAGLSGGLATRSLLVALADSTRWTVTAVDGAGKTLFSETFEVPGRAAAETEFVRARGAIEQLEQQFVRDHHGVAANGVTCADNESPLSSI